MHDPEVYLVGLGGAVAVYFVREMLDLIHGKKNNPDGHISTLMRQQETWIQAMREGMQKLHDRLDDNLGSLEKLHGKLDILIQVGPAEVAGKLDTLITLMGDRKK